MRHLPIALLIFLMACEGDDAVDPDSPLDKQGRVCLTTSSCNDAKLMTLGDLPEDATGSDQRIALVGEDIFVGYRANTTLHFAQWHAGTWKALPSLTVPTQPYSYDFVVRSGTELYLLQQSRGATSVSPFDGTAFSAKASPTVLAPPSSADTFNVSDVSIHGRYNELETLTVARAATFNTASPSAGVTTYIVRETLVYDPSTDVWSSLGVRNDASALAAGSRGSTNATTGLAALGSSGSIVATRGDSSILFEAVDDKTASHTVQTLVLPETPDFVSVTASADGEISAAWSTGAALRITTSKALGAKSDTADAAWTVEGTSLSADGSQGLAITYAGSAPVIAYAASSHDPVIHLRYWNNVDWIPFAQLGSDILSGQPGYNPVIAADISRVCVAFSEVAASTTKTRVICFGK